MIAAEGIVLGHRYERSRMAGTVLCYAHDQPTDVCTYDDDLLDEAEVDLYMLEVEVYQRAAAAGIDHPISGDTFAILTR